MRIFFVNRYFHPDSLRASQLLADLAFELAAQKHDVTVVTSARRHDDPATPLPARELIMDVKVLRLEGKSGGLTGLPGLATEVLSFHRAVHQALTERVQEGDLIVALAEPPMLGVVCERVATKQKAHLVHWLDAFYPEVTRASEKPLPGPVAKLLQRARKPALQHASLTVVPGDALAETARQGGAAPGAVQVIHPWGLVAVDASAPRSGEAQRAAWGLAGRFVVGYVGELHGIHDRDALLTGIEQTAHMAAKGLTWLFVGSGEEMHLLRGSVPMRAMDMVQFQPPLPMNRTAEELAVPDVHVVSLMASLEGVAYPGNLPGLLAAGRPLIFLGEQGGEVGALLEREGCGMAVQSGDRQAFAAAIAQLHAIPESRADMGRRARALYERLFARKPALQAWSDALARVASGGAAN
jgi:glycosyltransferase involved in cell wall biosynthesis